ncbi:thioredoxin fold domain-containing protein [Candidatus Chloroploca sp. M-50]|uniref:Thioredoxin fold domain-containing protein n=1 Tax=Candidatus Chloroploca mongolica TaxID=2528176 RepID=A0ABS4D9A0_9CHLR|nr:thioredoxin fold domain-containing protein [Candidatus Chloroploca mongolica]MBP1465995.1 thioredoxin fold domain-containing protein [Candidatus Chloroploca mongolica]
MTTSTTIRMFVLTLLVLGLLTGCGQTATPASNPTTPSRSQGAMVPVLALSELAPGPNRIAVGVLQDGSPINDPELSLPMRFFYLDGDNSAEVRSESTAVYRGEGLPFGLYVGYATFDQPGAWGVEITLPQAEGEPIVSRLRLDVLAQPQVPAVGMAAIPTNNLTIRDQPDLTRLTSDARPDADLYQMTISEAIAAGQPFVVAFSTPGYCQTAVCAPNQMVLKQLKDQYKGSINFIHVEVYAYPFGENFQAQRFVPSMRDWKLRTEPWTFLVDANGIIQARYEGGLTFAELEPALAQLVAGEPITPPSE